MHYWRVLMSVCTSVHEAYLPFHLSSAINRCARIPIIIKPSSLTPPRISNLTGCPINPPAPICSLFLVQFPVMLPFSPAPFRPPASNRCARTRLTNPLQDPCIISIAKRRWGA